MYSSRYSSSNESTNSLNVNIVSTLWDKVSMICVGTASPIHLLMFSSFAERYSSAPSGVSWSSFCDHLKFCGIVISIINSLILKTRLSLGWIVSLLASWSFLVAIHEHGESHLNLRNLLPISAPLSVTRLPSLSNLYGLRWSGFSNALCPSCRGAIHSSIYAS